MDLTAASVPGDLIGASRALRSSRLNLQHSFCPNLKSVVSPGDGKGKSSLRIRSAVNKLKSDIGKGNNDAIGPDKILIESVSEKAMELEEMLSEEHSLSENDKISMNLGFLEPDLQAALSSMKKKEDLKDDERKCLLEQDKLDQTTQDLEQQEEEIFSALAKQKRMEEDLITANRSLASQSRQIKDLKLLVKDRSEKVASSHHALSLKEDELSKHTDDLRKKDKEVEIMNSDLESRKMLLDEASKVIIKQEEKLMELQREITDKEHDLAQSLQLMRAEQERLKTREADLEKQTVEWLSAREELKALAEQASAETNDAEGTAEDFKRVRSLLSVLKRELVSAQKALASSHKNAEEQSILLEEKEAELDEQKLLVISYMNSLKEAELEVESERTKLSDAAARFDELKSQLSGTKKLILHLKEDAYKGRVALEQQTREITSLRMELQQEEIDYSDAHERIQAKESELVEARLRIQRMESELLEKSAMGGLELEAATSAMQKIHEFTRQLVEMAQASTGLDDEGVEASVEVAEKGIARLLGLTEELVKEAGITVTADTAA